MGWVVRGGDSVHVFLTPPLRNSSDCIAGTAGGGGGDGVMGETRY